MKKIIFFLISLFIGTGIFSWVVKAIGWQEIKKAFLIFACWQGLVIIGLTILAVLIGTWKWGELLKIGGVKIPFLFLLKYYLGGFSIMFFLPQIIFGGEVFKGILLREKSSVPGIKGIASVFTDRILEATVFLVVIFFGAIFIFFKTNFQLQKITIIFGAIFFVFVLALFIFYFKGFKRESIIRFFIGGDKNEPLEIEKEIFNFLKFKKKLLLRVFSLNILRVAVMLLRTWFLIIFLGKNIEILPALTVLGFSYLAFLIPIPAALGSHEAVQIFVFNSLGLGANTATAFTMAIRGAELIMALMGVIILFKLGTTLAKNNLFKKVDETADRYEI